MVEFTVQEPINMVPLLYPQHCEPPDDKEVGCYGIRSKVNLHYVKQHQCALEEDFPYKGKRTEDLIPMDGVYRAPNSIRKKLSLHALLIIGEYRTKSGVQVYDCQNSWGEDWGDEGFCKVEKLCLLKFFYAINPRVQGIPPPPNPLQVSLSRLTAPSEL
ncbi:hypothetical protein RHMOL_Rhmol07G0142800 [Rhododendron molle]|uniref:Uncharacterized protein n=2 Tax=Rhododendron molle TaxID=49168 RepID=A0ACC0N172_RHOML|nr:hypothetical protein RHMOL_Rhmol07G0142800 [Rhododendron molle]KAI8546736.1 hypothetical protein RHMOL_Rhmol07G0142800 [Rhododendron molle]